MRQPTIIFAHGRESGPWGVKIRRLARCAESHGCRVISRDDQDTQDPELRTERLLETAQAVEGPLVLVGSSMGGYVAAKASRQLKPIGLFLMAPAFGLAGYADDKVQADAKFHVIVHGWADDIVSKEAVLDFAERHGARLHMLPAAHALHEELDHLEQVFTLFLQVCLRDRPGMTSQPRLLATI